MMDIGKVVTSASQGIGSTAIGERWVNKHPEGYHKGTYSETMQPHSECYFYDDFWNGLNIYAAGPPVTGTWTRQITGAAPPTVNAVAGACGWVENAFTNADQKQEAGLYWSDKRTWAIAYGLQFEAKCVATVLPTLESEMWIGVGGNYVEGTIVTDGPAEHAFFVLDGSGAVVIYTDDTVNDNNAIATGVTLTAGVGACFRIDFTDPASVKFYINGVRVAAGTIFNMNQVPALVLQPYLWVHKESGEGVGTLATDYVRLWQERY